MLASRVGLTTIVVGVVFVLLGPGWFDGFVKGLFEGAGLALVVFGLITVGARWRTRHDGGWLPSRDDA